MAELPFAPTLRAVVSQEYLDRLGSCDFPANNYQIGNSLFTPDLLFLRG